MHRFETLRSGQPEGRLITSKSVCLWLSVECPSVYERIIEIKKRAFPDNQGWGNGNKLTQRSIKTHPVRKREMKTARK